jgi:recombination protein RecA
VAERRQLINRNFFSSGSALLDLVLGGGWSRSRVINIVGDRSTGKTLLAIEACVNFLREGGQFESVVYVETEAAFDESYARSLGMPKDVEIRRDVYTVEDLFNTIITYLKGNHKTGLIVVDSLDALSDEAERERAFDKGSYGTSKAAKMSEMFRRLISKIEEAGVTLMVLSQVRDNIGVVFGEKHTRSGGRALDFYASQIIWLSEVGKIKRTVLGTDRVAGIEVRARTKKNKVGIPFRETELSIMFGYGIDDERSMLSWIKNNKIVDVSIKDYEKQLALFRDAGDRAALGRVKDELQNIVTRRWQQIELELAPAIRKYE